MIDKTVAQDMQGKGCTRRLACSDETFRQITVECKNRIYKDNPILAGIPLSQNFILKRMVRWFLK